MCRGGVHAEQVTKVREVLEEDSKVTLIIPTPWHNL